MPSTATFRRGQVVVVNVPFSDRSGVKPRPALVIRAEMFHRPLPDLIVCPIVKRALGSLSTPDLARVETGLCQALGLT